MIRKFLTSLDKKYSIGVLSGLAGIIFGLLSVYTDFFRSNKPEILYDISSNATVVDLKQNIGKIDIRYDSVSILNKRQTVSLITIKISNIGKSDVLKTMYDKNSPLGLKIEKGIILERPSLIQASSNYIKESVRFTAINQSTVNFTDFIFEEGEFFVLKILVLHDINAQPDIVPKGKIAGVKQIELTKSYVNKLSKTFRQQLFEGSALIHISRLSLIL